FLHRHRRASGQRMRFGDDDDVVVDAHHPRPQPGRCRVPADDREVERAVGELVHGVAAEGGAAERQFDTGLVLAHLLGERADQWMRRGAREADRDLPDGSVAGVSHHAFSGVEGVHDVVGSGQECLALGREPHPPGGAVEQRTAEVTLQLLDRAAQRGLCDVQACRGASEVQLLGDGEEGLDVVEIHPASSWLPAGGGAGPAVPCGGRAGRRTSPERFLCSHAMDTILITPLMSIDRVGRIVGMHDDVAGDASALPLDGVRVVAMEQAVAAPLGTRHLADLGAEVIKVERVGEGDFARSYDTAVNGVGSHFVWLNRGKKSLALDVKSSRGARLLADLVDTADVFVQNLAPGAAARLGLDADTLRGRNPRLVTVDVSGYGESGPHAGRKAYDMLVQAETGLVSITGTPEQAVKTGIPTADIAAGMYIVTSVLSALL